MSRSVTLPLRLSSRYAQLEQSRCLHSATTSFATHEPLHHRPRRTPTLASPFSTSVCRRKSGQTLVKPSMKQPAQQSMSRARKEQEQAMLQSGQFPDDIGLLPDTFILPRSPRERYNWTIRKRWLYTRFWEWIATYQLRFMTRKPRPRLHLSRIPALAQDLHTRTLTAFAAGDLTPVQSNLSQGIFSSLKSRLATREPNTNTSWHLLATLSSPKLVSYKPILLPSNSSDKTAQRDNWNLQAVVRLHTRQSLQNLKKTAKRGAGGKMVEEVAVLGKPEVKEVVEYVVLQKVWRKARTGEWGLWGFADEMTLARLKREDARKMKGAAQGALTG